MPLLEQSEMSACVQGFIEDLPDGYRRVVLLHDVHGLTAPEIAGLCRSSVAAVKIRLHRARRRLEAALAGGCSFSRDERDVLVCEPKPPARRPPPPGARGPRPAAAGPRQR